MKFSDHKQPSTTIETLLPEVHRSEVNDAVFSTSFDRFLTKDDTTRVAGYIGQGNPNAVVSRQVPEATPHRQAYQLAPTMVTKVGTETTALSFKGFTSQLDLMGVDINRLPEWGSTLKFNWVPPINIDMLVNYSDYYWVPRKRGDAPQYLTIENPCVKATSAAQSFMTIVKERGVSFPISQLNYVENQFVITERMDDVFDSGFVFNTTSTTSERLKNAEWTVASSTYDAENGTTTITVIEPIATVSATAPVTPTVNSWWYNPTSNQLSNWSGTAWVTIALKQIANCSLNDAVLRFQMAANCACYQDIGWDMGPWDSTLWDATEGCELPPENPWSQQNHWVHKSEVKSMANATRAAVPIIEYSSYAEQNSWVQRVHQWKYRPSATNNFTAIDQAPQRIELEPIKGYVVENANGAWYLYLFSQSQTVNRDIDYTDTFVPGYKFVIRDDTTNAAVYTVESAEYRQLNGTESPNVVAIAGTGWMCTVIRIVESTFTSPVSGGGANNVRIEPIVTSRGDGWGGYHAHWVLDVAATTTVPVSSSMPSVYAQIDNSRTPPYVPVPAGFMPADVGLIAIANTYQQFTNVTAGTQHVDIVDQFQYNPATPTLYATPGSDDLRVYVNGVRQLLNYTEIVANGVPNYTLVGQTTMSAQTIPYVTAIVFNTPLEVSDVVRIEVGPAAYSDMGWFGLPVRTTEDETQFTIDVATGAQPVYMGLDQFARLEQQKTVVNQYPQFNMYDVVTGQVIGASPLFAYRESEDYPITQAIQRRIVKDTTGKEYGFEQFLVDRSNNVIYGYRDTSKTFEYWYNPLTKSVQQWVEHAWTSTLLLPLATGALIAREAVASAIEPVALLNVDRAVWFNTKTERLYYRDATAGQWMELTTVLVQSADPSLMTVWRHGTNNEQFVPQYVDKNRNPVAVGSADGDWGVVDQWIYNSEHKNYKEINFSQLVSHFSSITAAQPSVPGLPSNGVFALTQSQYNYGLGGTIHDHNNSFDTLISAVNVTNVTPVGTLEFASREYANSLLFVRDTFNKQAAELFSNLSTAAIVDQTAYVTDAIIENYESNDYFAQLYGDSSAYDSTTGRGVRNWIATAPMFGLSPLYVPHLNVQGANVELFHHDGHRTNVTFSATENDQIARTIINTPDSRVKGGKLGKLSNLSFPTTEAAYFDAFGALQTGVYWYKVLAGIRQLSRLEAYAIIDADPAVYDASGAELPDGVKYYNTDTQSVFEKQGMAWVEITAPGAGDITPLWTTVNLSVMLGQVYLEIERRLYAVTPDLYPVFDFSSLVSTPENQQQYNDLMFERFNAYVRAEEIRTPFVNTTYTPTNEFTWNYKQSVTTTPPASLTVESCSAWQELYTRWYNTPYPQLEPWKIQGYHDMPTWWNAEYQDPTGTRLWTNTMWNNLLNRVIPAGRLTPNGVISTGATDTSLVAYTYFSVNTATDQLLPPYVAGATAPNRSIFNDYAEIVAPDADYAFGDFGPVEWQWSVSAQSAYDPSVVAFQMQPAAFLHAAFGPTYAIVDSLQVDALFKQVYSHEDALFHGDIYDVNKSYYVRGLNQWYVNYNRYTGYDTNGEFRQLWAGWDPKQTHQFGGIVDTSTLEISNKNFDVISSDYNIILANSGVLRDTWVDAFEVSLIGIPPAIVQYNNQSSWKLEIDSLASIPRTIQYYGTKTYPFNADPANNVMTAFNYNVVGSDSAAKRFYVSGDQTAEFTADRQFNVTQSTVNDGTYTVRLAVFEQSLNRTRINVNETVAASNDGGVIDITDTVLPWDRGDQIVFSSTKFLPAPLLPDTPYYIIPLSVRTFQVADNYNDALIGVPLTLTTRGDGTHIVAQLESSFFIYGGAGNSGERWYHYALDKTNVRTFVPPTPIQGMQSFINLIDGYAAHQVDTQNILYGVPEAQEPDPMTGRQIDWMVETERFIDWAYGLRQSRMVNSDSYAVSANPLDNTLKFTNSIPMWRSGTMISLRATGALPVPLMENTPYYVVTTGTAGVIKVSTSSNALDTDSIVDLTTDGNGTITVSQFDQRRAYPRFELNPTRNNIFITTPTGVLANVVEGPYTDIRVQQTIFDQYNRPLQSDVLSIYRQDGRSRVNIMPELANDVDPIYVGDPYNYIHIGGAHLFIEGYEHFLILNDYTVSDALIYDQFYGLWAKRFEVDYYEKEDYTLRPTLGGYFLIDGQFRRNFEGATVDMTEYYDTNALAEMSDVARYSRKLLGYNGKTDYLNLLGVNSKSQFMFYKGMIQSKGSINSVNAYTNSRRFLDAKVDEFWAWKVADFGDRRPKVYPEIKLFPTDSVLDDVRLEFLSTSDVATDPEYVEAVNEGFQLVSFGNDKRWNNFPEQRAEIISPLFLDADTSSMTVIYSGIATPPPGAETTVQYWFDTTNIYTTGPVVKKYDSTSTNPYDKWVVTSDLNIVFATVEVAIENHVDMVYVQTPGISDDVRVLRRTITQNEFNIASVNTANQTFSVSGNVLNDFAIGVAFTVVPTSGDVSAYTTTAAVFNGSQTVITVNESIPSTTTAGIINVRNFLDYTTEIMTDGTGVNEFTRVNSENIRFDATGFTDLIVIFTLNPSKAKINPAKLVDTKSQTVVQQMPLWHPAKGYHSPTAIHNVSLQHDGDPARYEFTPNPLAANNSGNFWNQNELGSVWLDTSYLGYMPYYDDVINPDINARLYSWGKLAPWGDVRAYSWVESTLPPSAWDQAVIDQANDITIPPNSKATGTPYTIVSKRTRTPYPVTQIDTFTLAADNSEFEVGDYVLFTTTGQMPAGLEASTKYLIGTVTDVGSGQRFTLEDPITEEEMAIGGFDPDSVVMIVPAFTADQWEQSTLLTQRMIAATVADQLQKYNETTNAVQWFSGFVLDDVIAWTPVDITQWDFQGNQKSDTDPSYVVNQAPDLVDVYVNGKLIEANCVVRSKYTVNPTTPQLFINLEQSHILYETDLVDIVRPEHVLTQDEADFNPDADDDGTINVQWKRDYQYSTQTKTLGSEMTGYTTATYFYFWVRQATTRNPALNSSLSVFEVEQQLTSIPTSYFVVQRPKDDPYLLEKYGYGIIEYGSIWSLGVLSEAMYQIPVQYRQAIIRKVSTYLTDGDRYIVRFTRDWTLRDDLSANGKAMNLKDKHEEWLMFRRDQLGRLPEKLWQRMVEAVVGYRETTTTQSVFDDDLTSPTYGQTITVRTTTNVRVPAIDRELYDEANGTDTRFGLGTDQAFVDRTYALQTILAYLANPDNDFWPINIDTFFASNSFTDPEGIKKALTEIYQSFPAEHVNGIWFETLADALATKSKYKELMKTSWLALHGVRLLDVDGSFDD